MSTHEYVANFEQPANVIFGLLIDAERHHRILPFCKSAEVTKRRTIPDGQTEVDMHHLIVIQRIGIETKVRSAFSYQTKDRTLEMVSYVGDGANGLRAAGRVDPDGSGSQLRLALDVSGLPLRYRLLLIEPVMRRAHTMLIEKLTRRAGEATPSARARA